MKLGILGSGDVAKTLGSGFLSRGHEVMLGTRDLAKVDEWRKEGGTRARTGSFAEAAAFGEIVVIATLGMAALEAIDAAGKANFDGKIVIDVTNPLRFDDAGVHLAIGGDDSLGERVQRALPSAKVVKTFNTVGSPLMIDPQFLDGPGDMFLAGEDGAAKATVAAFVRDFGWRAVDLGPIESARYLEAMCMAWVMYGRATGGWNHAFKFIKA